MRSLTPAYSLKRPRPRELRVSEGYLFNVPRDSTTHSVYSNDSTSTFLSALYRNRLSMFSRLRILKNSGSTARDHLASERTFLAWLRTGLGFIALGIAVERFSQFEFIPPSSPSCPPSPSCLPVPADSGKKGDQRDKSENLVLGLLATGSGSIVYGTTRYFSNMRMLEKGLYKPSFFGAGGLSAAVVGLTAAAYWEIIWNKQREKD